MKTSTDKTLKYQWTVVWRPEDEERFNIEEFDCIATEAEVEAIAHNKHPDFLCSEIIFNRKGAVLG